MIDFDNNDNTFADQEQEKLHSLLSDMLGNPAKTHMSSEFYDYMDHATYTQFVIDLTDTMLKNGIIFYIP